MTVDQALLFTLFAIILGLLLWGRIRYDLVAAGGLLVAVVLGLIPDDQAFSGFSNPAVMIVALVLITSRAFENSGILTLLTDKLSGLARRTGSHIIITGGLGAGLSAIINNVAALALLMPFDVQAARKAERPPGITLMPLAFATILGGMVTLIGTPPNIIASSIRADLLGAPYQMFDFTPVGLAVAVAGLAFVALIGWRLVPRKEDRAARLIKESFFEAQVLIAEGSEVIGRFIAELEEEAQKNDVLILGLIRDDRRYHRRLMLKQIEAGDILVIEGSTDAIAAFLTASDLHTMDEEEEKRSKEAKAKKAVASKDNKESEEDEKPAIVEAVVRADSIMIGRSAKGFGLRSRFGITLLGIARSGIVAQESVNTRPIEAGDVLLLIGQGANSAATLDYLGTIPVNRVSVKPFRLLDITIALGFFLSALAAASTGMISFPVAIAIAVAGYAASGLVPAREFYQQIEWPVIVLLACLLPIGEAFDRHGGTSLIAQWIVMLTQGAQPVIVLAVLMVVTMTLSDVLNNVATIIIMGPVAVDLAFKLGVNPDTFLMGAAVASSCAFLTPIGHKNNMLIMGPGGFSFGDYWRMGLPLEIVVLLVSIPALLMAWPL